MKTDSARAFERLLVALERELVTATDDEVLEAARDLGMDPTLKGSSVFFGVTMSADVRSGVFGVPGRAAPVGAQKGRSASGEMKD